MTILRWIIVIWAFYLGCSVRSAFGFSEGGHHVIATVAFSRLDADLKLQILHALSSHPRYAEDFQHEGNPWSRDHWLIGRASYWPDVASGTDYDRPTWHYQLGAVDVIGSVENVPEFPGPLPEGATLETQELYIAQAITLCRRVISDPEESNSNKAIAICWLCHLVADAHQPCHAGSLYVEKLFPEGDRGANSIKVIQGGNLHALWDGLLGKNNDYGDVTRRARTVKALARSGLHDVLDIERTLEPATWLAESHDYARKAVYTSEILEPISVAMRDEKYQLSVLNLSAKYLSQAGEVAHIRAYQAAMRLTEILEEFKLGKPAEAVVDGLDPKLESLAWLIGEYENSNQHSLAIIDMKIEASSDGKKLLVEYTTDADYCEGKLNVTVTEILKWNAEKEAIESTYHVRLIEAGGLGNPREHCGYGSYLIEPDETQDDIWHAAGTFQDRKKIGFQLVRTGYGFRFERVLGNTQAYAFRKAHP